MIDDKVLQEYLDNTFKDYNTADLQFPKELQIVDFKAEVKGDKVQLTLVIEADRDVVEQAYAEDNA